MKIVHIIVGLGDGGAEKSLYKLVKHDPANEHVVISLTDDGRYGEPLRALGVTVVSLGWAWQRFLIALIRFTIEVRRLEPDVVHGWMPHGCLAASIATVVSRRSKIFWSIRASDYGRGIRSAPTNLVVRFLAANSNWIPRKIFVVSEAAIRSHSQKGFAEKKMVHVPNGFEVPVDVGASEALLDERPATRRDPTFQIGMVARYHRQKDHHTLLTALSLVYEENQNFRATLVGAGMSEHNRSLVDAVRRAGLEKAVELAGPVENPAGFYRSLDLHVLSSSFGEGFPNVVAESMLEAVPNVVTDVGDAAEVVGDTGWVVRPRAAADLAEAILRAMQENAQQLASRGAKAKQRIVSRYPMELVVNRHLAEYRRKLLLVLPRYADAGASSRVRMFQFFRIIERDGWEVVARPFFDDRYLEDLYSGRRRILSVFASYWRRFFALKALGTADLAWVEKELFPWLPHPLEKWIVPDRSKVVYDFDDAVHEQFLNHPVSAVRVVLGGKIRRSVASAAAVLAGNPHLLRYFQQFRSERNVLLPSVIDTEEVYPRERPASGRPATFVFGWIGTPVTWNAYGRPLLATFEQIAEELDAEFWVLGSGRSDTSEPLTKYFEWSSERENEWLNSIDVGIMPLTDNPWSRGKCGYKLIQYMAVGVPVLASPVGVNREIVSHGVNGYFIEDVQDWVNYLRKMASDPQTTQAFGARGLKLVREAYSVQAVGEVLTSALNEAYEFSSHGSAIRA